MALVGQALAAAALQPLPLLLSPLVQIATLEIIGLSAYYIYRQKLTAYTYAKSLLLADYVLFAGVMVFEFLRTTVFSTADFSSSGFAAVYTVGATGLILLSVVVLTLLAVTVYLAPTGIGNKSMIRLLWDRKVHVAIFGAYTALIAFAIVYLAVVQPFEVINIPSVTGVIVPETSLGKSYLLVLLVVELVFILYPSLLLFLASRKAKDVAVKRVLRILPVVWSGVGVDLLVFNGYFLSINLDATPFGYLIASVAFGVTAFVFRRASLLTSFFEPVATLGVSAPAGATPFTRRLGMPDHYIDGRAILLEADPSVPYEQLILDYASQGVSEGLGTYVFTRKGSPVYNSLRKTAGVRFYMLSTKVSYPKPEEGEPSEILVPANDSAVLLDMIDKTITTSVDPGKVAFVFDNLSDMILSNGFEATYKFVKQVGETVGNGATASLFLMTYGAHDEKVVSFMRSLFPTQIVEDAAGARVARSQ
ncbi:MAG: hypothetical protein JRM86_02200 [Nitrososphaerota archaeon]|nr:hypothetical protein [Nitrososphaerota archaeon]MDG7005727.1 hypothetical protein [Nitrososphaerota archaeon]